MIGAIWDLKGASAREIHDRVGRPDGLAYTTTAKVLDRLYAKGLVSRERRGRGFVYEATIPRDRVEQARARQMLTRLFGAAPRRAIAALVGAVESLDPVLLDELGKAVASRRRARRGA